MKSSHICPKCRSSDILKVKGTSNGYGAGNCIQTGIFAVVLVHRYVCCNCGYAEEWIDKEDIPKIKKKYSNLK